MIYLRAGLFADGPTDYRFLLGLLDRMIQATAAEVLSRSFDDAPSLGIDAPKRFKDRTREERIAAWPRFAASRRICAPGWRPSPDAEVGEDRHASAQAAGRVVGLRSEVVAAEVDALAPRGMRSQEHHEIGADEHEGDEERRAGRPAVEGPRSDGTDSYEEADEIGGDEDAGGVLAPHEGRRIERRHHDGSHGVSSGHDRDGSAGLLHRNGKSKSRNDRITCELGRVLDVEQEARPSGEHSPLTGWGGGALRGATTFAAKSRARAMAAGQWSSLRRATAGARSPRPPEPLSFFIFLSPETPPPRLG
jgi:hypothetical protein